MTIHAEGVNPVLLRWAREQAGYSFAEVAQQLQREPDEIRRWEAGEAVPTYFQLEQLADRLYKRPIALFFFPEPPDEPAIRASFRTLPDLEIEALLPDTRYALREATAMQIALRELSDGTNPSEKKIFRDLSINTNLGVDHAAAVVRGYLSVPLETQIGWKSDDDAFKNWRAAVEAKGVFVFKRSFKHEGVSGFCLIDDEFPVVYINNGTAKTRQQFSLFHELAHLLLGTSGITMDNDHYIDQLDGAARDIEVFCNAFTAEFLVPSSDFERQLPCGELPDQTATRLAKRYHVSREVVLRRLLGRGIVDQAYYETKAAEWLAEYHRGRQSRSGGGNYYATQATYLGDKFLGMAFNSYYNRHCTLEQLADYLNVKVKNVSNLEQYWLGKASTS